MYEANIDRIDANVDVKAVGISTLVSTGLGWTAGPYFDSLSYCFAKQLSKQVIPACTEYRG